MIRSLFHERLGDGVYRQKWWLELGTGPTITIVDIGARLIVGRRPYSQTSMLFFDQAGLMAGIGLQGTKITKVEK